VCARARARACVRGCVFVYVCNLPIVYEKLHVGACYNETLYNKVGSEICVNNTS